MFLCIFGAIYRFRFRLFAQAGNSTSLVLIYLEVGAVSVGVSEDFAFYLISIANASSLFGRLTASAVTDRMG